MLLKYFVIPIFAILFFFSINDQHVLHSAETSIVETEILPIASFLFAQRESMRVGWYKRHYFYRQKYQKQKVDKPIGSLFVQIRPRKFEGEYRLALRVLKDGSHQFRRIRGFTNGKKLNHKNYITIPFEFLIGAIQGEALRSIFPNDRVEFGGWLHQITYNWETPELLSRSFTKSNRNSFLNKDFEQGKKILIPWENLRPDLELQPLAVKDPLFIKKDETGLRYAFYRLKPGESLYSSVVIRFIGGKKHYVRNQNANDLLVLNRLENAHQISEGQLIKIPLQWIRSEYLHQVPSIYKNILSPNKRTTSPNRDIPNEIPTQIGNKNITSIISQW